MLGLRLERRRREEKSVVVVDSGALNCPLGAKNTLTYARDVGIYVFYICAYIYICICVCVCEKNTRIAKISSIHCTTQKVSSSHHHHDE